MSKLIPSQIGAMQDEKLESAQTELSVTSRSAKVMLAKKAILGGHLLMVLGLDLEQNPCNVCLRRNPPSYRRLIAAASPSPTRAPPGDNDGGLQLHAAGCRKAIGQLHA